MKSLLISTAVGIVLLAAPAMAQDRSGTTGSSGTVTSPSQDAGSATRPDRSRSHDTRKKQDSDPMAPPGQGVEGGSSAGSGASGGAGAGSSGGSGAGGSGGSGSGSR
jgi:hypothetical protein